MALPAADLVAPREAAAPARRGRTQGHRRTVADPDRVRPAAQGPIAVICFVIVVIFAIIAIFARPDLMTSSESRPTPSGERPCRPDTLLPKIGPAQPRLHDGPPVRRRAGVRHRQPRRLDQGLPDVALPRQRRRRAVDHHRRVSRPGRGLPRWPRRHRSSRSSSTCSSPSRSCSRAGRGADHQRAVRHRPDKLQHGQLLLAGRDPGGLRLDGRRPPGAGRGALHPRARVRQGGAGDRGADAPDPGQGDAAQPARADRRLDLAGASCVRGGRGRAVLPRHRRLRPGVVGPDDQRRDEVLGELSPLFLLAPVFGIAILVVALNLLGDAIRDAFDPKTRR